MLLNNHNYIDEEILNKLYIDYKKIDGNLRLISNNIYFLDTFLSQFHNNYIQYDLGLKAAQDFSIQIKNYQDRYFTFIGFNLNDILVIDGNKFLLIPNQIYKLKIKDHNVNIYSLKQRLFDSIYIPPELRVLTTNLIPISTNNYSIGFILLNIIFNDIIEENLEKIKYTSLYYCIKRCIQKNPRHRFFVLI